MNTPGKLFGFGVVIQIIVIGLMIWAVVVGISYVREHGLKTIATEFWEGTDNVATEIWEGADADSTKTK